MEDETSAVVAAGKSPEGWVGWVESVIITVSQTSLGQTFLKLVDRFLWVVEKSAQWSLPCQEVTTEENGKSFGKMELVRPLPWILFLPGLVILRAIRGGLNVGAFILGYPQIQPSGMVKFVQKGRRRLRALNLKAIKNLRRKTCNAKDKRLSMIEAKKALIRSIKLTLSTLSCLDSSKSSPSPPPTKIHISGIDLETVNSPEEKSTTESVGSPMQTETKRKFSEVSSDEQSSEESENETLQSKIDRLALDNSSDDPDFNPAECSTESSTASSENGEKDMNVSLAELEDVKREAQAVLKEAASITPNLLPTQSKKDTEKKECDEKLPEKVESVEATEFHSPSKFGPDGDATFYSPISSKSGSPERSLSPCAEKEPPLYTYSHKASDFSNGEVNCSSGSTLSGASTEEVTNGVVPEKRSANIGKHHHKGKRSSHGNRRKK